MKKAANQYNKNIAPAIFINAKNIRIIYCAGDNIPKHQAGIFGKFLYGILLLLDVLGGTDFLSNLMNL